MSTRGKSMVSTMTRWAAVAGMAVAALPAWAHHSGAMFDRAKVQKLEGTIVKYDYVNPHSWSTMSVPGPGGKIAFLIDQSSSAVTWTAVKRASEENRAIPLGWALDVNGKPTTDPHEGLEGSMAPAGGTRGFGQGLIVEVMCAALAASFRGPQMNSFTDNQGKSIGCGQFFIAISPKLFAPGSFDRQIKALTKSITAQEGARMPNARRVENQKRLKREGLTIEAALYEKLKGYCA